MPKYELMQWEIIRCLEHYFNAQKKALDAKINKVKLTDGCSIRNNEKSCKEICTRQDILTF